NCQVQGYSCCSNPKAEVLYRDDDGIWSIENGEWCFIRRDEKETPKLIRTCPSIEMGYPCCKKQELVYTDTHGQWGIEDGNWCGIYKCTYTGDYPICKTTKEIVYTDTEKWGVEDNQWCVLC
ncbi:Non-catalytic module family DOC2, partial [Piromyces sp. E2]